MRFEKIGKFEVEELLLDEDNYRFLSAKDQASCIEKIFTASSTNFKNMMSSIAEDDLGEILLVYHDETKNENIVLDGNRRLSAIKVLKDPETFAPSDSIKKFAKSLLEKHEVNLSRIQAYVSTDKPLILKTVYERHAAGKGKSTIGWTAYSSARFRYDNRQETDQKEWYAIALLLETEKKYPIWTDYIDSKEYSHETFRRIFRAALRENVISQSIFSDRDQRIKASANKKVLNDAIEKTNKFLKALKTKDISLSRGGQYADKEAVDAYIASFELSPDNVRTQSPDKNTTPPEPSDNNDDDPIFDDDTSTNTHDNPSHANDDETTTSNTSAKDSTEKDKGDKKGYGIDSSKKFKIS